MKNNKNQLHLSSHAKLVKRTESIAKGSLWVAAGITIGILFLIIGFILFKGFVSIQIKDYPVISDQAQTIALDWRCNEQIIFIVNNDIRADVLTIQNIRDLFTGEEVKWTLAEQYTDVIPFALHDGSPFYDDINMKITGRNENIYSGLELVNNIEQMIKSVSEQPGAIGYITKDHIDKIQGKNVKTLKVKTVSLIANKYVLELIENIKLRFVKREDIIPIFSGNIKNWQEIGGIDLEIQPVLFEKSVPFYGYIQPILDADIDNANLIRVKTFTELLAVVKNNPGAVAFAPYLDVHTNKEIAVLQIEEQEVKPNLGLSFLIEEPHKTGRVGGISTIILNTFFMIILTLLFATPIGLGAAIYFVEYSKQNVFIKILRFFTETLAGIPSIIFGLFGYILFVNIFGWGMGLISGTVTITIMVLPTIIRTSEEALKAVPKDYRTESFSLGATKWQTVKGVVVPSAIPGIITGVILAIGRAVGETAAVIFTLGSSYQLAHNLTSSARVLSLHLYILVKEGISFDRAFATGTILVAIILIINLITVRLMGRINKLKQGRS